MALDEEGEGGLLVYAHQLGNVLAPQQREERVLLEEREDLRPPQAKQDGQCHVEAAAKLV